MMLRNIVCTDGTTACSERCASLIECRAGTALLRKDRDQDILHRDMGMPISCAVCSKIFFPEFISGYTSGQIDQVCSRKCADILNEQRFKRAIEELKGPSPTGVKATKRATKTESSESAKPPKVKSPEVGAADDFTSRFRNLDFGY